MGAGAMSLAPMSVVAPLGGLSIVCQAVLAHIFLDEHMDQPMIIGVCVIVVGMGITSAFG